MTLRISVGMSKKVGQPNFGSFGASCQVEVELDCNDDRGSALQLQARISRAFSICKAAVESELALERHFQQTILLSSGDALRYSGLATSNAEAARDARQTNPVRNATAAQLRALERIARAAQVDLLGHAEREFGIQSIQQLSIRQASALIDRLKALPVPSNV